MPRMHRAAALIATLAVAVTASAAQVELSFNTTYCHVGETCTLDVWVSSTVPLGKLSVVLRFNNAYMTVTNVANGGYLPTLNRLWWANDICEQTILCEAPGGCGQIDYLAWDAADATSGHGLLLQITYTVNTTTSLWLEPCPAWCNEWTCASPVPRATSYDGVTSYSLSFSSGSIIANDQPLADSDGDCLNDSIEAYYGTDPNDVDTDDDGVMDGTCARRSSSNGEDLNNDGVVQPDETDPRDADTDDDGLFDGTEMGLTEASPGTDLAAGCFVADADPGTTTDPSSPDSDGDGVPDGVEDANHNGKQDGAESSPTDDSSVPDFPEPFTGTQVLVLGDDDGEGQVQAALEAAGHVVTVVNRYYEWDGISPDVRRFDTVVLLSGYDYGYDLEPAAASALSSFVANGCGFVVTEWSAYDVYSGDKTGKLAELIPVLAPDGDYDYGFTWSVTGTHPLTADIPASWWDDAGSSVVRAKPGAIVLIRGEDDNPLLSFKEDGGGPVVHLNHTMTYNTSTIHANALQLIVNAAGYSDCQVFFDGFEDGTPDEWSAGP